MSGSEAPAGANASVRANTGAEDFLASGLLLVTRDPSAVAIPVVAVSPTKDIEKRDGLTLRIILLVTVNLEQYDPD